MIFFYKQMEFINLFPSTVNEEERDTMERSTSKEEVLEVLKALAKEKSLGPDGWLVELFLNF